MRRSNEVQLAETGQDDASAEKSENFFSTSKLKCIKANVAACVCRPTAGRAKKDTPISAKVPANSLPAQVLGVLSP